MDKESEIRVDIGVYGEFGKGDAVGACDSVVGVASCVRKCGVLLRWNCSVCVNGA